MDGADADDGLTWATAKEHLSAALTAAGAGGTVYVSDNHAETTAGSISHTSPGTAASPVRVICVDDAGNPEPPTARATTATVTCTGNTTNTFAGGVANVYGVTFNTGSGAVATFVLFNSATQHWIFDNCVFSFPGTSANPGIIVGSAAGDNLVELINTPVSFGGVATQVIRTDYGKLIWRDTPNAIQGGFSPVTVFATFAGKSGGHIYARGVDLSAGTTNLTTVNIASRTLFQLENCKLGTGVTIASGSITSPGGCMVSAINCDSADTNYRYHKQTYQGTITQETTIVRTGGATDGTTPISRKMVTTANSMIYSPLVSDPIIVWADNLASTTVTVETVTDNVTLTDAMAWIDVEYLGTSGFPLSVTATDRISDPIFGTPANQTTSTAAWTTTGLATPVKQQLSVTFTPAEKGPYRVYVNLANNPSTPTTPVTMYFCPKVSTGARQFMVGQGGYINVEGGGVSRARIINSGN